jgi:glycosyltransferase involved in cell wall biosynthesis
VSDPNDPGASAAYRFAMVVEQNLGHRAHYRNLTRYVPLDPEIAVDWFPIEYENPAPLVRLLGRLGTNMTLRASLTAWDRLRRLRGQARPDAVFFHTQTTALLQRLVPGVPAVVSLDATPINFDSLAEHYDHRAGGSLEGLKRRVYSSIFNRAAALVTWSRWAKDSLVQDYGVPAQRISVVQPGVDLEAWGTPDQERRLARAGGLPRLLFVGGDFARKGGETLLQAFRERLRGRCELHVVTQAELPPEPGLHVYHGVTPNSLQLRTLYADADIFVFPTLADCLAQVIPEAMAAGLPVITTPVGATPEVVEEGVTGRLVEPRNPARLAQVVEELLDRPEQRVTMGTAGRRRAEEVCDARRNAAEIVSILKRVKRSPRAARSGKVQRGDQG